MKILVTGIAGFLGSHLAEKLMAEGHTVYGIDNLSGGYLSNIPKGIAGFWQHDTAKFQAMKYILMQTRPDVIYHCACTAYEGLSVFSPAHVIQNTLQNTAGLLSAAIQAKVKRFVYCSSMSRYGNNPTPFTEDMIPNPHDPYAVAKVAAEQVIKQMSETHGIEYVIAVPHNIIGTRQKYDDPYRNVASIMINRMLQGKPAIIYGDGNQRRSFSFVGDCVETLARMIDCPSGGVYNIGPDATDGTVVTINELHTAISSLLGLSIEPIHVPDRPREVKDAWCSSDKIRREFGYRTSTTLMTGLQLMIEDIKTKGVKPFDYSHINLEITHNAPATWLERKM